MKMKLSTRVWGAVLLTFPFVFTIVGGIVALIASLFTFQSIEEAGNFVTSLTQDPTGQIVNIATITGIVALVLMIIGLVIVIRAIHKSKTPPESALRHGWSLMKKSFWRRVTILLVGIVVIFAYSMFFDAYFGMPDPIVPAGTMQSWIGNISGTLLQIFIGSFFSILIFGFAIDLIHTPSLKGYGKSFDRVKVIINWIVADVFYNIIVAVGLLLLVVPGVYWAIRFTFWNMFIVDKGYGPIKALKASWRATRGYRWEIAILKFYQGIIQIPGLLLVGLGLLATIPTSILAHAKFYEKITDSTESNETDENDETVIEVTPDNVEEDEDNS